MLIYSYKFENYIRKNIIPNIILSPKYIIKGSFKRKIPYITDIDIINNVYPSINKNNIYSSLLSLIKKISKNPNIILLKIICGRDSRFNLDSLSEIDNIKPLLNIDQQHELDFIINKYSDPDQKLFYINNLIKPYYKLRWTVTNVIDDKMILPGSKEISMIDTLHNNSFLIIKYYVIIKTFIIGFDIVITYEPVNFNKIYKTFHNNQIKYSNYLNEYYYMLFPLRYFFKKNEDVLSKLNNIIDKQFGLAKQILAQIEIYQDLYNNHKLSIKIASMIILYILTYTSKIPIQTNILQKITDVAIDNYPDVKMKEWNILLITLYDEIYQYMNINSKNYFFEFLSLIPKNIQKKFFIS